MMSLLCACGGLTNQGRNAGTGEGTGASGTGGSDAGEGSGATAISSSYGLRSVFSITAASVSPEPAYQLLSDLNDDPGQVLVTLAGAAGVPAAETLFDALPTSLSGRVEGWMSEAIGSSAQLQVLMAWSRLVLAEVEVQSTLSIASPDQQGRATASHVLDSLVFEIEDLVVEEEIPQIESLPGAGHAELSVLIARIDQGLQLQMGEQRFGLLFGEAAYRAFESLVQARYGSDLRGVLGTAIDCTAMASEVAERCVLSVCVGHSQELEALCEGALDSAVERVRAEFSALDTELLRLESGQALVQSTKSGTVLAEGQWQAQAELGQGLRSIPARFTGDSL